MHAILISLTALAAGLVPAFDLAAVSKPAPVRETDAPTPATAPVVQLAQSGDAGAIPSEPPVTMERADPGADRAPPPDTEPPAATQAVPPPDAGPLTDLSGEARQDVVRAAAEALASVETARGRFVQLDPQGQLSRGSFALRRPGRMRFDYDDPTPITIAADGTTVAVRDSELQTVDRVPLASTPLTLLLDDRLDFETEAEVVSVQRGQGLVTIALRDRSGEAEGMLTLFFEAGAYDLLGWRTLDSNGGVTAVELSDVETGVRLDPRLFVIEDFEDEDDRRRR